jgi:hypothetical protein
LKNFSTIRFEVSGGIARIILNRPEVLNAINPMMVLSPNPLSEEREFPKNRSREEIPPSRELFSREQGINWR